MEIPNVDPNQSKLLQLSTILGISLIKVEGHFKHAIIPKQLYHQIVMPALIKPFWLDINRNRGGLLLFVRSSVSVRMLSD